MSTRPVRSVSLVEVSDVAVWAELEALVPLAAHLEEELDPTCRVARPSFHAEVVPVLARGGLPVLLREARQPTRAVAPGASEPVAPLSRWALRVLHQAQRHATGGLLAGFQAWDPERDLAAVRELLGAGLLVQAEGDEHLRLAPDLPEPPPLAFDPGEAVMPPTDDLSPARPGPISLLHDLATLAAAIDHTGPARTLAGTIARADVRRLASRLGTDTLQGSGALETDPRWGRALRALEALGVVAVDPLDRSLHLDLGLEDTLLGDTPEAVDRFVHRLVDADLRPALPILRETLRQAAADAVDVVVWLELVRDQQRDLLVVPWQRDGGQVYPASDVPFDEVGFDLVEAGLLHRLLDRVEMLGLVRRAPGVFAATDDGRRWAGAQLHPPPPVWVSSDLQVIVPPDGVTPWERFQLERLGRCLRRDVVDVYVLERSGLVAWLRWHDLSEALALLARRAPAVPAPVVETLTTWARQAMRVVLTRGVLL